MTGIESFPSSTFGPNPERSRSLGESMAPVERMISFLAQYFFPESVSTLVPFLELSNKIFVAILLVEMVRFVGADAK
jgi:hypothetical protein